MAKCSSAQKSFVGGWVWGRAGGVVVFLYHYTNTTELVGFWVGFEFGYKVRRPRRCYGYVLRAYIIGQLSCPRCRHTTRLL